MGGVSDGEVRSQTPRHHPEAHGQAWTYYKNKYIKLNGFNNCRAGAHKVDWITEPNFYRSFRLLFPPTFSDSPAEQKLSPSDQTWHFHGARMMKHNDFLHPLTIKRTGRKSGAETNGWMNPSCRSKVVYSVKCFPSWVGQIFFFSVTIGWTALNSVQPVPLRMKWNNLRDPSAFPVCTPSSKSKGQNLSLSNTVCFQTKRLQTNDSPISRSC